jgi:acyl-CoA synthetase (AMP-forming)/AMP-acid ligase II
MFGKPTESGLLHALLSERRNSRRIALVSPESDVELAYAELHKYSEGLAVELRRQIASARPRVALLLPNSAEFVVALFAVSAAGGVAVPVDTYAKREELLAILQYLNPDLVITNASLQRKIKGGWDDSALCLLELDRTGLRVTFPEGSAAADPGASPITPPAIDPEEDAVLILTSGTTGHPKAVRLSHRAIRRNIDMHLESLGLEDDIISLQVLPLAYSYGLIACLLSVFRLHGTAVLTPYVIEPKRIHAFVDRYGANLLMGTPLIFQYLLERGGEDLKPLQPLRYLTVGGERCRPHVVDLVRRHLPWTRAFITYGLSEAGPRVSTLPPELFASLPQSVGRPLRGVEIAILDSAGHPCLRDEAGEVVLRTPSLMNGYFRDKERTDDRIRDGWLYTGDMGRLDARGFLYLLGRRDGEFKFRGRRIHPGYIEQIVFTHPHVQEVHVTRGEDGRGEFIRAVVKARVASEEGLVRELKTLCRQHLPASLVPSEFEFYDPDLYLFKGKPAKQVTDVPRRT